MNLKTKGLISGVLAFFLWGIFPLYWKWVGHIPSFELLGHRVLWGWISILPFLLYLKLWSPFLEVFKNRRTLVLSLVSGVLILANWGTYVWSIENNFLVECSLAYFVLPLANVFLGMVLFEERPGRTQLFGVLLAGLGILYLLATQGGRPDIIVAIVFTFSFYGVVKKKLGGHWPVNMFAETTVGLVPAVIYFCFLVSDGNFAFVESSFGEMLLVMVAGPLTIIPLILFAESVTKIPLSTVGVLQYIAPTLQFLIGIFVFEQKVDSVYYVVFPCIWLGILFYLVGEFKFFVGGSECAEQTA